MRYWILVCIICFSCTTEKTIEPLFSLLPSSKTKVTFSNDLKDSEDLNIVTFEYFYNGGGVAAGDLNNDGWTDLVFTGNMVNSRIYFNHGDFNFEDRTEASGFDTQGRWATGVNLIDINMDGWLDIYISCSGPVQEALRENLLFINNQDGTFREEAASYGLNDSGHTTQTVFFDMDRDGDLDAYMLTNIMDPKVGPNVIRKKKNDGKNPSTDRLYRNDEGTFINVSDSAGIVKEGYGLGVSITDINQDGWLDIYVTNDYLSNDLLYINQADGTFVDHAEQAFRHTSYSAMGNDVADINNDGQVDIIAVDMLPPDNLRRKRMIGSLNYDRFRSEVLMDYFPQYMRNTLQVHQGKSKEGHPVFYEIGQYAGIHSTDWSWSPLLADLDNDGWKDLLITNGFPKDITNLDFSSYKMNTLISGKSDYELKKALFEALKNLDGAFLPNFAFRNNKDFTFENVSQSWGFVQNSYSNGATLADLDNDGDLDYIVNNINQPASIYRNNQSGRNYLRLSWDKQTSPALYLGAKVNVFYRAEDQFQEFFTARGYQSSLEPILHFGLDTISKIDSIQIVWMNQTIQTIQNPKINQTHQISYQPTEINSPKPNKPIPNTILEDETTRRSFDFTHKDPHYSDFKVQPLLLQQHAYLGPALAVGDINGDELEDVFFGGSFKEPGTFLIQKDDGTFHKKILEEGENFTEDVAAALFDADQDGDLDLYLGSGGSEFPEGSSYYQDRLYLNDGSGNFTLSTGLLPQFFTSTAIVVPGDFDGDGDLDLFIGSRIIPQRYAEIPKSYLLENRNGKFVDISASALPKSGMLGRISDAKWINTNGNAKLDLVLTGEWMEVTILTQNSGLFLLSQIPTSRGLWNAVEVADLDQDGDLDILVGNLGTNNPYGVGQETPLTLRSGNFSNTGELDFLITGFLQHKEYPIHFRDDFLKRYYRFKKTFPSYTSYGQAEWKDYFEEEIRANSTHYAISNLRSGWYENKGGDYLFHPFPPEVQWAPLNDFLLTDLNGDDLLDIVLIGNNYAAETNSGRLDASSGWVLLQIKKGEFELIDFKESGFFVPNDGRALAKIKLGREQREGIVAAQNSQKAYIFTKK